MNDSLNSLGVSEENQLNVKTMNDKALDELDLKDYKLENERSIRRLEEEMNMINQGKKEEEAKFGSLAVDQYWSESKRDIFQTKLKPSLRDDILEEWDDYVYMIRRGRVEQVKEELKMNQGFHKDVLIKETGETILHICAEHNQVELFKFFVKEYFCDVGAVNQFKENPCMIAAKEGKTDIVRHYIETYKSVNQGRGGFHINNKSIDGWTALQYAVINGFGTIAELLVTEGGADINCVDRLFRSPLHWACRFNSPKLVERLLKLGIRYSLTDIEGKQALDLAEIYKCVEAHEILETHISNKMAEAARKKKKAEERRK